MRYVVSDDVDFDSFGMAPWDSGGMHGNDCQRRETFRTMMLQWLLRLLCRQATMNGQMNGFTRIIGAMVDCWTVGGCRQLDSDAADCGAVGLDNFIFRRTSFPPDDLSAGRDRDYIWRDLWTGLSVCNRSVTGSLTFGSSHRLGRCCLWLAALPFRWRGSAEVPL